MVHTTRTTAEHEIRLLKSVTCKNTDFSIKEKNGEFEVRCVGCKNQRANGSSFCQKCSDRHNKK